MNIEPMHSHHYHISKSHELYRKSGSSSYRFLVSTQRRKGKTEIVKLSLRIPLIPVGLYINKTVPP
jgi:hypothetical protein